VQHYMTQSIQHIPELESVSHILIEFYCVT
jgi:hypothetical protein